MRGEDDGRQRVPSLRPESRTSLFAGTVLAAFAACVQVQDEGALSEPIDYRTSVMTVFAWNLKPMGTMLKGKRPYDETAARG